MKDVREGLIKCGIPDYMQGGVMRWIDHGIYPGSFLTAVIENNLKVAAGQADDTNRHLLWNYVNFFWNYAPLGCWGSPEKARQWYVSFLVGKKTGEPVFDEEYP